MLTKFAMGHIRHSLRAMGSVIQLGLLCAASLQASAGEQADSRGTAALAVLERVTEQSISNIRFDIRQDNAPEDWFEIQPDEGTLNVAASSVVSATYGAYQYLEAQGAMSVSWEGKRIALPEHYEGDGLGARALFRNRAYLNVCAYGYSTPWWDWDRWEKEIDWMALHGVNHPVAMEGQEYVWKKLWKEFGLSDEELQGYFSGPAFTPWQRMGNIEFHGGALPDSWIEKKKVLQTRILDRMRGLGMEPVLPAFSGYVPRQFREKYPEARIYAMEPWSGFERETYWLDPADPLFSKIAKRFLEIYRDTYGAGKFFLSDSFNEMPPPVSGTDRHRELASYGKAIYDSIADVVPDATWVLQGWMFGADKQFWDHASIEAFLSEVPDDRTMVHDIGNDRYHVWEEADAFHNKNWIYGFIHNYGASNPVYGDFDYYRQEVESLLKREDTGSLAGFGVFPEGIENNSIVYEFLFDLPWQKQAGTSTEAWLARYLSARYGHLSDQLLPAWRMLLQSVYQTRYWSPRWWEGSAGAYVLFKRPALNLTGFQQDSTELAGLRGALELLINEADEYPANALFLHDLTDLYRHYLTLRVDLLLQQSLALYRDGRFAEGRALFDEIAGLVVGLDGLLGAQPNTLAGWLRDAYEYGDTLAESAFYLRNAKLQIGVWGGDSLKDYASKAWHGMYRHYYLARWQRFFMLLEGSDAPDMKEMDRQLRQWEMDWANSGERYGVVRPADPVGLMRSLLEKVDKLAAATEQLTSPAFAG